MKSDTVIKDVPSYEGLYRASSDGVVYRVLKSGFNKAVKGSKNRKGYLVVKLCRGADDQKSFTVHRVIAMTFLGDRPDGLVTDHIDGNRTNNSVDNLQYITNRENVIKGSLHIDRGQNLPLGVSCTSNGKYRAVRRFEGKSYFLGSFDSPDEASDAYLSAITKEHCIERSRKAKASKSSRHVGVSYIKAKDRWRGEFMIKGKSYWTPSFKTEREAFEALIELREIHSAS